MSGSGSSDGEYGSGGAVSAVPCANLFVQTVLTSPNPSVIGTLQVGDVLDLKVMPPGSLVAVTNSGAIAGSIVSANLSQLIVCIQSGTQFIALVLSILGGACDVQVRPK